MNKRQSIFVVVITALFTIGTPAVVSAQEAGAQSTLEEIIVTGRKREESLTDVPVSISVLSAQALIEEGILNQQDLFDAVPGMSYDVGIGDRNSSQPQVRGIQANEIATTLQKVNTFIDGIPMLGQVGSLSFAGVDQVEIYRGPQSAAFGRSTFAGAINYVTADATEEFEGKIQGRMSSLQDQELGVSISGPLGDKLGYRVSYIHDRFTGPDEWTSTDGFEMGAQETKTLNAKLNFEFSETVYGEVMYTRLDQSDAAAARWTLDPANCSGDSGLFRLGGGMRIELPSGGWDCDIFSDPLARNHDVLGDFRGGYNEAAFTAAAGMGLAASDTNGDGTLQVNEYLAQTARDGSTFEQALLGQTVLPPLTKTTRDRVQGEINFEVGDNLLTFMGMHVDEFYQRWFDHDGSNSFPVIFMGMLQMNTFSMSDPTDITENYAEVRWASPAENRLRYTLSGSYYSYDFHTDVYINYGAQYHNLTLPDGRPVNPRRVLVIANNTTNYGASFGLQYDLTDQTTLSFEGRYQSDENCGLDDIVGVKDCSKATSFAPRIAINTAISENHSAYAQFSRGTNPGGVVIAYSNPDLIQSLRVAGGLLPVPALAPDGSVPVNAGVLYNGVGGNPAPIVGYDENAFNHYDEEVLTNFEIGAKGSYADGRGSYEVGLYYMDWADMILARNLSWDDDTVGGWNEGGWSDFDGNRTFVNDGDGELFGLEFATNFNINDIWSIGGNVTLQDASFKDFCSPDGPLYTTTATPPFTTVLPVLTPAADGVRANCSVVNGNQIPRTSDIKAALNARATLPNDVLNFRTTLRADLRHVGPHYIDDLNLIERKSVTTLNLSANMRNDDLGLTLRFYVNNVFDQDEPNVLGFANFYTDNANPTVRASQARAWRPGPRRPREFGLSAIYDF